MSDSCMFKTAFAAAFGGAFGGLVTAASSTFFPTPETRKLPGALRFIGKSSLQYAAVGSAFAGAHCVSEAVTGTHGAHNAVAGGIATGVVGAILSQNHKIAFALGGSVAIALGAFEVAGGSFSALQDKDYRKLTPQVRA